MRTSILTNPPLARLSPCQRLAMGSGLAAVNGAPEPCLLAPRDSTPAGARTAREAHVSRTRIRVPRGGSDSVSEQDCPCEPSQDASTPP